MLKQQRKPECWKIVYSVKSYYQFCSTKNKLLYLEYHELMLISCTCAAILDFVMNGLSGHFYILLVSNEEKIKILWSSEVAFTPEMSSYISHLGWETALKRLTGIVTCSMFSLNIIALTLCLQTPLWWLWWLQRWSLHEVQRSLPLQWIWSSTRWLLQHKGLQPTLSRCGPLSSDPHQASLEISLFWIDKPWPLISSSFLVLACFVAEVDSARSDTSMGPSYVLDHLATFTVSSKQGKASSVGPSRVTGLHSLWCCFQVCCHLKMASRSCVRWKSRLASGRCECSLCWRHTTSWSSTDLQGKKLSVSAWIWCMSPLQSPTLTVVMFTTILSCLRWWRTPCARLHVRCTCSSASTKQ